MPRNRGTLEFLVFNSYGDAEDFWGKLWKPFLYEYWDYIYDISKELAERRIISQEILIAACKEDLEKITAGKIRGYSLGEASDPILLNCWLTVYKKGSRLQVIAALYCGGSYWFDFSGHMIDLLLKKDIVKVITAIQRLQKLLIDEIIHKKARKILEKRLEKFKQTDIYISYVACNKL